MDTMTPKVDIIEQGNPYEVPRVQHGEALLHDLDVPEVVRSSYEKAEAELHAAALETRGARIAVADTVVITL